MPTLKITDLRVWNQKGEDATLFLSIQDAISLAVGVELSPDLTADLNTRYSVAFQIIDAATNSVVVNSIQVYQLPENWPSWWFTAGNNWDPPAYTTAEKWGLPIFTYPLVFGFRGILTAAVWDGSGLPPIDAFHVSPIRWFQLSPQFSP